jgi:polyphosphate kinase 2 (PPK2 family)
VLVERVEGLATKAQWKRAYREIVEFERGVCVEGAVIVKFWMHISAEEQLGRFNARAGDPLKAWKLTEEDWRNRDKRPAYEHAVEDMLRKTDHQPAPWTLISGENKSYARVAVIEAVIAALERGMRASGQEPLDVEAAL